MPLWSHSFGQKTELRGKFSKLLNFGQATNFDASGLSAGISKNLEQNCHKFLFNVEYFPYYLRLRSDDWNDDIVDENVIFPVFTPQPLRE